MEVSEMSTGFPSGDNNDGDDNPINLQLPERLKNENIVTTFLVKTDRNGRHLVTLELNHKYEKKTIVSDIHSDSWIKTITNFSDRAKRKGVLPEHIEILTDTLDNNHERIIGLGIGQRNNNSDGKKQEEEKASTYKYSKLGRGVLHESIILGGIPTFVKYENGKIESVLEICEPSRILKAPYPEEYPYRPYEFASIDELEEYVKRAKKESIYSLYQKAKSFVKKYIDQDEHKQILIALDIVWTYFQDKFSTTHYLGVVGDNGSGKSTVGDTFEAIAYRAVNLTNPSAPNVFRMLGTIEPGQCTLILDESDKMDESSDMMSILKTGYHYQKKVVKTNTNSWKQEFYWTYSFKVIIAERSPNQRDARGVLDRTLMLTACVGNPVDDADIKEVMNPQGDPIREMALRELIDFRKLMLVYRLIHFADPIPDINIGVKGRNKELFKPYIQLFQDSEAQNEIEETLQKFLDAKNERKSNSLEAALIPITMDLISKEGNPIPVGRVWQRITVQLDGQSYRPDEFQTEYYGVLYRTTITKIMCDKFGADAKHTKNARLLQFHLDKLEKIRRVYESEVRIHTTSRGDRGDRGDGSTETPGGLEEKIVKDGRENNNNSVLNITDNVDDDYNDISKDSTDQKSHEKGYSNPADLSPPSPPSPPSPCQPNMFELDGEQA
jgi:hypothetical protein